MPRKKETVLFICTSHSAVSQMAEGLVNSLMKDRYEASSAGTVPTQLDPRAVKVMKEINVDISRQKAVAVNDCFGKTYDLVITLCDEAEDECPFLIKGGDYIHKNFKDPSKLKGEDEKVMKEFRALRDDLRAWLKGAL
jgi:arsenate reductase